ncbi:MAG: TetR/AcrR family transcriptional regulator [Acidimicrobiia bacterium]|nr:TetR/AcrR family transcriptional regulator [Acidimicrobiia bacterium]
MARPTPTDPLSTRQRILEAAAALFARRGFHGTSTREIASEVGIRQPSLFHHFPTKQAMLAELLDLDLQPALERIRRNKSASPAVRLYAYLLEDVAALVASPFDVRGLYNDAVLEDDDLSTQRRAREALHAEMRSLVSAGMASGDFRRVDPEVARQMMTGMLLDTIWAAGSRDIHDPAGRAKEVADFVLRGLLDDCRSVDEVEREATRLVT